MSVKKQRTISVKLLIVSGIGLLSALVSAGLSYFVGVSRGHLFLTTLSGLLFGLIFGVFYGVYYIMER